MLKVLICVGLYLLMGLAGVRAQEQGPDNQRGQRMHEIFRQLDLTDTQKQALEANKQENRSRIQQARQEMKSIRQSLQQEIMLPELNMARINELHARSKVLMAQMEDEKLNSILSVRTILTPAQFAKFVDLMHRHKPDHDR